MSSMAGSYDIGIEPSSPPEGPWTEYVWMVVCAALASFFMAWGIGANDVANSFATSVGSRTLKLWQAVVIAGIFEFSGALGLGGETTKTIASDIARVANFTAVPEIYMYGMLCSLTIAGVWLFLATFWRLPVSTTHSIIGSIMGFSLVFGGWNGVLWNEQKGDFPYSKGFLPVVLSWFFSPLIGGTLSAIIFNTCRFGILRRANSTMKAIYSLPILLFFTFFINIMFVLAKGAKSQMAKTWPCDPKAGPGMFGLYYEDCSDLYGAAAWIAAVSGVGIAILAGIPGVLWLKKRYNTNVEEEQAHHTEPAEVQGKSGGSINMGKSSMVGPAMVTYTEGGTNETMAFPQYPEDGSLGERLLFYVTFLPLAFYVQCKRGLFYNIFEESQQSEDSKKMHSDAEVFNPHTEKVFQALQVLSACCVAFAHGSNDVANSIGPFSAIYNTYLTWKIPSSKSTTPEWMFVLGGFGIVLGLVMFGYNIIMQIGVNMLHLTPSRGFSAELAAGLTISLASFFGIPVSTTQIIVGAEVGIGLSEGRAGALDWRILTKTALGWVYTIILSLAFCAALFSAGAYAPSIIAAQELALYRNQVAQYDLALMRDMNATNLQWTSNATWWNGTVAAPLLYNGSSLNAQLGAKSSKINKLLTPDAKVPASSVLWYNSWTLQLWNNYSITAIGQNDPQAVESGEVAYAPQPTAVPVKQAIVPAESDVVNVPAGGNNVTGIPSPAPEV